eukprot:366522-Chlamydomonas_euryale.AAC.2
MSIPPPVSAADQAALNAALAAVPQCTNLVGGYCTEVPPGGKGVVLYERHVVCPGPWRPPSEPRHHPRQPVLLFCCRTCPFPGLRLDTARARTCAAAAVRARRAAAMRARTGTAAALAQLPLTMPPRCAPQLSGLPGGIHQPAGDQSAPGLAACRCGGGGRQHAAACQHDRPSAPARRARRAKMERCPCERQQLNIRRPSCLHAGGGGTRRGAVRLAAT